MDKVAAYRAGFANGYFHKNAGDETLLSAGRKAGLYGGGNLKVTKTTPGTQVVNGSQVKSTINKAPVKQPVASSPPPPPRKSAPAEAPGNPVEGQYVAPGYSMFYNMVSKYSPEMRERVFKGINSSPRSRSLQGYIMAYNSGVKPLNGG